MRIFRLTFVRLYWVVIIKYINFKTLSNKILLLIYIGIIFSNIFLRPLMASVKLQHCYSIIFFGSNMKILLNQSKSISSIILFGWR